MINVRLSSFFDAARWIAAFAVVISHIRMGFLLPYSELDAPGLFVRCFYAITKLGHEAVIIFFVISGFLVGGLTSIRWSKGGTDVAAYCAARSSRIYVVLIPALLFGAALDLVGARIDPSVYGSAQGRITSAHFLSTAVSLQSIVLPPFGSNSPLWSLANEWWYYVIFGFALYAVFGLSGPRRAISALAVAVLLFALPIGVVVWGMIWLLGVALVLLLQRYSWRPPLLLAWMAFFLAIAISVLLRRNLPDEITGNLVQAFIPDLVVGTSFCLMIAAFDTSGADLPMKRWHKGLAEFSFSLYVVHTPALVFLLATSGIVSQGKWSPSLPAYGAFLLIIPFVVGAAWLFYLCFERQTQIVRELILSLLGKRLRAS